MPAVALEPMAPPAPAERVALVRAQLEPIRSRLELAYAVRWLELAPDAAGEQWSECPPPEVADE
ncbi:MAG TPA: hypothetical protein VIK06_08535 [Candidatus Limnocylindrales bacterium]|jgi:hypothetical protein